MMMEADTMLCSLADIRLCSLLIIAVLVAVMGAQAGPGSKPKFKQVPIHDVVALVDGSHKFLCKVKGTPKPFLVWYHGNEMLSQNDKIKIGKYSLKVSNLKKSDAGEYACKATNTHGGIWGNFTLQVIQNEEEVKVPEMYEYSQETTDEFADLKGPPEFKKRLKQVRFLARAATGSVDFDCDVLAYPEARITWWRNGKQVKEVQGKYIFDGYKLNVKSLALEDEGNYTCVVHNEYGSVTWTTRLEVQQEVKVPAEYEYSQETTDEFADLKGPPEFKKRLNQVRFLARAETGSVDFDCDVLAYPEARITWWRNGKQVKEVQGKYIFDGNKLNVKSLALEDEGNYTCIVRNEYGSVTWTTRLEVQRDEKLASFLEKEIKDEQRTVQTATTVEGWDVKTDGTGIILTKSFNDEVIRVEFDVNDSVDSEEPVFEGSEQQMEAPELVSKPPFEVEIQKKSGRKLRFFCEFSVQEPQFADDQGTAPQENIEDQFSIVEVRLGDDTKSADVDKFYSHSAAVMDGTLYDLLMDMLDERGVDDDFINNMVAFATAYEYKLYLKFLEDLKSVISEK